MKVLILINHQAGLYKFRKELLERLVQEKHNVYISVPEGEYTKEINELGVRLINNRYLNRRGTNPLQDIRLLNYYKSMLEKIRPNVVLTYTIKPNVYGGMACARMDIPYVVNVTGLGTSIQDGGLLQKITLLLYRYGLRKAKKVFFQNNANRDFMLSHKVIRTPYEVLPGSGVNVKEYDYTPYPKEDGKIIFTTIGRIMKDKGIDELLFAAKIIRERYTNIEFRLIGDYDENYQDTIEAYQDKGVIRYLGSKKNIKPYIAKSHAIIHPSYHEGMSNVLLEAASMGRPVIASDIPGCREIYEDGITGYGFMPKDAQGLVKAIEQFLSTSYKEKVAMGKAGRQRIVQEFDRKIVVNRYIDRIEHLEA